MDQALRLKRLEALADLWGKVYLFHPTIAAPSPQPSPSGRGRKGEGAELDWNRALIRALPRVEAADTPDELAKAINEELLEPLGDLLTFAEVQRDRGIEGSRDRVSDGEFESRRLSESVGYVRVPPPQLRAPAFLVDFEAAVHDLGAVDKLVVDLRWPTALGYRGCDPILRFFVHEGGSGVGSRESRAVLQTGPVMSRVHEGWSEDNSLGAYRQKWEVVAGSALHSIQEADAQLATLCPSSDLALLKIITKPTVFLVNRPSATACYKVLDALQSQPGIAVVFEPTGSAQEALRLGSRDWGVESGEGLEVQLNTERLVAHDGRAGFRPNLVVEKEIGPTELAEIAEKALSEKGSRGQGFEGSSGRGAERVTGQDSRELLNLRLPAPLHETGAGLTREERLLGLFKVWSVIRYVYPHLELCDMDWETSLSEWIPKVEAADSAVAYVRTLRMLTAHLHDNNIFYFFPDLPEPQALPIVFGWVENKVIITDLIHPQITQITQIGASDSGPDPSIPRSLDPSIPSLLVGDELIEFDGKTVPDLIAEHRLQFSYSTEGAFYRHMVEMLGFGTAGAEVKLVFRRSENGDTSRAQAGRIPRAQNKGQSPGAPASDSARDSPCFPGTVPVLHVTLKRTVTREEWITHLARKRQSPGYRMLEGNIGYMDLARIASLQEFELTFEAMRRTDGLIVDIRGYPGFMVQLALSSRLKEKPVKSAIFEIPVVSGFARLEQGWNSGQYEVQPDPNKHYSGPVVVLINEKTLGGAEDVCIYLKNAGRVTFVGGVTAGCNGNRTWLSLPGGGRVWFTGMRVKFGDGSQFQNVGIVPDVPAAPTVDGVKAGRDEVLEQGLEVLTEKVRGQGVRDSRIQGSENPETKDKGQGDKGRRGP